MTVGHGDLVQTYREECAHLSEDEAKEAVCQRALALNVEGFLEWLRVSMAGGGEVVPTGQAQREASEIEGNQVAVGSTQDGDIMAGDQLVSGTNRVEVDWQAQLARELARHSVV